MTAMAVSYKIMKYSAICQTTLGIFLMVFGCIDRSHMYRRYPTVAALPVWMGFWVVATGFFGMGVGYGRPDGPKIPVLSRAVGRIKTGNYLGLSVISCFMAGSIIVLYSHGISLSSSCPDSPTNGDEKQEKFNKECHISHAVCAIIILTAIAEFGVSIWACFCCCYNRPTLQQGQTVFIQNRRGQAAAYVIDHIDPVGRAVVLRNPLEALEYNPDVQLSLWNESFVPGPPPPYTPSEGSNEENTSDARVDGDDELPSYLQTLEKLTAQHQMNLDSQRPREVEGECSNSFSTRAISQSLQSEDDQVKLIICTCTFAQEMHNFMLGPRRSTRESDCTKTVNRNHFTCRLAVSVTSKWNFRSWSY